MALDGKLIAGVSVLTAVIEAGSFARAAEALGITPSGVSRAVTRLETRMGVRLLDRTTRSLTLTGEGQALFERVLPLLESVEHTANEVAGASVHVGGRLRVDLDPFLSRVILARDLKRFLDAYPDLTLDFIARQTAGDLVRDQIDVAIRFGEPGTGSVVARKLLGTRILTVAAPSYLKKFGRPGHPEDLAHGHHCIHFRNPATGRAFDWEFHRGRRKIVVPTTSRLLFSEVTTMTDVCLAGAGIAQVMDFDIRPLVDSGRLVDLFPDWPDERFPLYALYPSRRHMPAKVDAFIRFVAQCLERHQGSAA